MLNKASKLIFISCSILSTNTKFKSDVFCMPISMNNFVKSNPNLKYKVYEIINKVIY